MLHVIHKSFDCTVASIQQEESESFNVSTVVPSGMLVITYGQLFDVIADRGTVVIGVDESKSEKIEIVSPNGVVPV
jgi:hypothetical protein